MSMPVTKPKGGVSRERRYRALKDENDDLRARMGMTPTDLDMWEAFNPQDARDMMAAQALVAEWGDARRALMRLGIAIGKGKPDIVEPLAARIFLTPGCQAIMNRDLSDATANHEAIVKRMSRIATLGTDDTSVKATQVLAKLLGWQKTPDTVIDNRKVQITLQQLVNPGDRAVRASAKELPAGTVDAVDFLGHEPGPATRISTDENMDAIIMQEEQHDGIDAGVYDGSV
jgi:hypothetical protein